MSNVYSIAMSGLQSLKRTVHNHASNIANAHNVGRADGSEPVAYMPVDTVTFSGEGNDGVRTETVLRDPAHVMVYDANSPFANEEGVIATPNVSLEHEIIGMQTASSLYKANAAVIRTQKEMDDELLNILS